MAVCKQYMSSLSQQLCSLKEIDNLASLLQSTTLQLMRLRFEKPYLTFEVSKNKGKQRLIESPKGELKKVLRILSNYLHCVYFFSRTPAAYGFIQQPRNAAKQKNILTNAKLHCGKKYLLNIDLKDFFHQVSHIRVISIFRSPPFNFNMELSNFLSELTTYKNRLPMGSPTSPVLSNFATIKMDNELLTLSHQKRLRYSRYVDDLTFSSNEPIDAAHFYSIYAIISQMGFRINQDKLNWMGEQDEKMVTGLVLKDKPQVTADYIKDLESNLEKLKHVLHIPGIMQQDKSREWIEAFEEHLLGKMRFLRMINGPDDFMVKKMYNLYNDAHHIRPFVHNFRPTNFYNF